MMPENTTDSRLLSDSGSEKICLKIVSFLSFQFPQMQKFNGLKKTIFFKMEAVLICLNFAFYQPEINNRIVDQVYDLQQIA